MYIGRQFDFSFIWFFAWKSILRVSLLTTAVYFAHEWLNFKFIDIPFLLVSTIGTAVAFYVGFKNNSSYERLWEARKIWGAIVNTSRSMSVMIISMMGHEAPNLSPARLREIKRELIYRQIAWVNVLRLQLRRPVSWNGTDEDKLLHKEFVVKSQDIETFEEGVRHYLLEFTSEKEFTDDRGQNNIANNLLRRQAECFTEAKRGGLIDAFEHRLLMEQITACFDQQGAAERIKGYPFPRQYAIFSELFVSIFIFLLPFGLIYEMSKLGIYASWLIIPLCTVVAWVYYTMEQVGDASENPFENALNDVPMTAICRNIEIDLRELLGESDLPAKILAVDNVLL